MAFTAVTKAVAGVVAEAVFEAKKQVIKDFAAFMADKIDFDDDMQAYFDEFVGTLVLEKVEVPKEKGKTKKSAASASDGESSDAPAKKKRAPSAYNLFIKEKMAEIKANKPELKGKDLMRAAIDVWNIEHPKKPVEEAETVETVAPVEPAEPKKGKSAGKGGKKAKATESESDA
jgi:hypothetical protein